LGGNRNLSFELAHEASREMRIKRIYVFKTSKTGDTLMKRFALTFYMTLSLLLAMLSLAFRPDMAKAALPPGINLPIFSFSRENSNSQYTAEALADSKTFLPLAMNNYPLIPAAPILDAITNNDGDGNYTVSWSSSAGATTYTLEEDDNVDFSSPTTVYSGSSTSKNIGGRDVGTYDYRVRASNGSASSDWSNVVSVEVIAPLPDCPQAGFWRGTTSQGMRISFVVENSPECQIEPGSLFVGWSTGWSAGCSGDAWTSINIPLDIVENKFDYSDSSINAKLDELHGIFTSSDVSDGTFQVEYTVNSPYTKICSSGVVSWEAQPLHGVDGTVDTLHIQSDGKILIGGYFTNVNEIEHNNIARLNPDGSLDGGFTTDVNSYIYTIAQQADGKILIGGSIADVNGQVVNGIARLNDNGSLDTSFTSEITRTESSYWTQIYALDVLADGDILVGGEFNEVNAQERNYVARLNPNGSLDEGFNANIEWGDSYSVNAIAVHENMIYIGGEFVLGDYWTGPHNLVRLYPDGSLDESFNAQDLEDIDIWEVDSIGVQPDGKIIVLYSQNIVRLNQDGTKDTSFIPPAFDAGPTAFSLQGDGKIVVGGYFSGYIIKLETNGAQNQGFNPDPNDVALIVAIQPDGKIVVGGEFTKIGGAVRHSIARLNPDGSIDTTFDPGP
jgi:uncharacterized delta-60 repeat protein